MKLWSRCFRNLISMTAPSSWYQDSEKQFKVVKLKQGRSDSRTLINIRVRMDRKY